MKKLFLFSLLCCAILCVIIVSCTKRVKIPLEYEITDTTGISLKDIYIPDSGTFEYPVWVKFLTGNTTDKVTISFSGLPADVRVSPDSFSGKPSYVERFVFYTNHAVRATYPVTIVAYTPTTGYKYFKFNLGVIPTDCTADFIRTFTCKNACSVAGNYSFTATASSSPYKNTIFVNNFGGYGSNVNVEMVLDCTDDSVFVPEGDYGNNTHIKGQGIFTSDKMIIWYSATSTPGGFSDNCVDTMKVIP